LLVLPGAQILTQSAQALTGRAVVLVSKLDPTDIRPERAVARLGGRVEHAFSVIDGFSASVPRAAMQELAKLPGVRWVTENRSLKLLGQYGQDSGVASAVYTDVTRASRAWSWGYTGNGVNVALIDTGVNTSGDLAGQVIHAEDFTSEHDNQDNFGHGTFVAGLIAGTGAGSAGAIKGEAPGAKIVSLKIAGRDGTTDVTSVLEALEWVVTYKDAFGIRVVNLSLGFNSHQSYTVDPLDFAVERVWNAGIVVITAAGNGGDTPGTITTPGNDPFVITVGSETDATIVGISDDRVSPFSSSGPTVDGITKPDLLADGKSVVSSRSPGSNVDVTYPNSEIGTSYTRGSGTSFSAGIVSGIVALMLDRTWNLSPNQVKYRLTSTAHQLETGVTPDSGAGVANAAWATMTDTTGLANQGITPATGGGSLQATRGSACVQDQTGACMTDAAADAALGFNEAAYFGNTWAGSQWAGSQWASSQWAGTQWTGSQWAGSQWAGSQWAGSQWAGSQWADSQWAGSQWAGSQWAGSQWAGTQWATQAWTFIPGDN
jgi:serine protease AprX